MRFIVYAALVGLPLLDIATLIAAGGWIGAWPTIGLVLLSAMTGVMLVRSQGLTLLTQARATLSRGELPAREVFDGACLLIGGGLLALPGFASDLLGAILLVPAARRLLARLLRSQMARSGGFADRPGERQPTGGAGTGPLIEGEYEIVRPTEAKEAEAREQRRGQGAQQRRSPWNR